MTNITTNLIKKFRDQTGAGMMDCKKYLSSADGNFDKAIEIFRKEGQKIANKKAGRTTNQGLIDSYIHPGNKIGVLIEVNCETDFVAKNEAFQQLVHDLAMHIAAFDPQYLNPECVPQEIVDKEKEIYMEQMKNDNKPADVKEKIIQGKLNKFYEEVCFSEQKFLKNDKIKVQAFITENIAKIGENIKVARFSRFSL
ncbi:MAG: translation elongation factor Ts [Patescibacteria group bacterium]